MVVKSSGAIVVGAIISRGSASKAKSSARAPDDEEPDDAPDVVATTKDGSTTSPRALKSARSLRTLSGHSH